MDTAFKSFFLICIIILAVLTFLCLIRTIKGPRLVDRIVGTNMIGAPGPGQSRVASGADR